MKFFSTLSLVFGVIAALVLSVAPASAQLTRSYTARYAADIRGDILLTGNSVLRPVSATANGNNSEAMAYTDVDSVALTPNNSSSAILKLPTGVAASDVAWARLYWTGRIEPAPENPTVSLSVTGSGADYQSYTAAGRDVFQSGNDIDVYVASVDVTAQVQTATGAQPTILVGGVQTSTSTGNDTVGSQGALGGWSMVVVYRQNSSFIRQLRVFDGAGKVNTNNPFSTTLTGFRTPDQNLYEVRFGVIAYEGDVGIINDRFRLNGTELGNTVNPTDNFFNSSVSQDGDNFTSSEINPPLLANGGTTSVDVDRLTLTGQGPTTTFFPNATTSATISFTSNGDEYYPVAFTTSIPTFEFAGRVFEDLNYGGGVGRAFNASNGMQGVEGARVEAYNANTGAFVAATTTDANGFYYFYQLGAGRYRVRVVNDSVRSKRPNGATATGTLAVQTYRTEANTNVSATTGSASVTSVTDRVGGEDPSASDALANTTSANYSSIATGGRVVQSSTEVILGSENIANIDFGFNFNTIVNRNNTGQGSLRQFLTNANALGNAGLNQEANSIFDPAAGQDTSIWMLSNGSALPGLRAGLPNQFSGGQATITPTSPLPPFTDSSTRLSGLTQTALTGETATVDTSANNTATTGPEVVIDMGTIPGTAAAGSYGPGLYITAQNTIIEGMGITRSGLNKALQAGSPDGVGILVQSNVNASGTGAPTAPFSTANPSGTIIRNNTVFNNRSAGIRLDHGASNITVENNVSRGVVDDIGDGIELEYGASNNTITGNRVLFNAGYGFDLHSEPSNNNNVIETNIIRGNGTGPTSVTATGKQGAGIGIRLGQNNTIRFNTIYENNGDGIIVRGGSNGNLLSQNSIYANANLGIDLITGSANNNNGDGVSGNNGSKNTTSHGNAGMDYPIFTRVVQNGANLDVAGYIGNVTAGSATWSGATIEIFTADNTPANQNGEVILGDGRNIPHGEGRTYVTTITANAQGLFTASFPYTIGSGQITATARDASNNTSEFSASSGITSGISGYVYLDVNQNATFDASETGTGQTLFVKLVPQSAPTAATVAVAVNTTTLVGNANSGFYEFSGVFPGNYTLVLDDNATLSDITPTLPATYSRTEAPSGTRSVTMGTTNVTNENFGLYVGSSISGRVFKDTGTSGGIANDGAINGGETGLENIVVELRNGATDALISTTLTDANGNYSFAQPTGVSSLKIVQTNRDNFLSTGATLGNSGGTYTRSTDTIAFSFTPGQSYTNLNFGDVPSASLAQNNVGYGEIGNSVLYSHTFMAGSTGTVTFSTANTASPANPDWGHVVFLDTNGNGVVDAGEGQITAPINVVEGQELKLLVQHFIPLSASDGNSDQIALTANVNLSVVTPVAPISQTLVNTDLTTVGQAPSLQLVKSVDLAQAQSGQNLTYTIVFTNTGNGPISNLRVSDSTPAFTTFVSQSVGTLPASLSLGTATTPAVNASGALLWSFNGTLQPGESGTVIFVVKID